MTLVDSNLFDNKNHYLGRPADFDTKFIQWRLEFLYEEKEFLDLSLSLIDIGCGNGATMFGLKDHFSEILGVDINNDHEEVFNNYKKLNKVENCSFKVVDIENDKFDLKFDRLTSFEVIEHLENDSNVQKMANILKKDGIAIFSIPNKWWIFETHGAKLPLLPWNRVPFFSWLPRFIHEKYANARIYTKRRFRKLLENNGFEVLEMRYMTAPMDVLKKNTLLKRFVTKYIFNKKETKIPFLAVSIYVKVKRK